jgi:glycosyltransferase involved in cell wall biosynthesis
LAEGFGWPLIEAQACGCPVITTDEAPMNEVAGKAALYLPRLRMSDSIENWASAGAQILVGLLAESTADRDYRTTEGRAWAQRFDANRAIEAYLGLYARLVRIRD